jgi:lactonase
MPLPGARNGARLALTTSLLAAALLATGCSTAPDPAARTKPEQTAKLAAGLTQVHPETGMTLLEGPTFSPDGQLHVVDVTAPPGKPKVLKVDLDGEKTAAVYTDQTGTYTSAQFSPLDGRLYLTDFIGGKIISIIPDGQDPRVVFSGEVEGTPMNPDDLAFDETGNMYVSDSKGHDVPGATDGRIIRIDPGTSQPTVLATDLPAPNGISFDSSFTGLWVSQLTGGRIDYLRLNADRTAVTASHPAVHFSGGHSQPDSNAVDAAGNIYQAVHGQAKVFVYSPDGELLTTVTAPPTGDAKAGPQSATNIAIKPGTTDAYMTVSGPEGGRIYEFAALGIGIRQTNGG